MFKNLYKNKKSIFNILGIIALIIANTTSKNQFYIPKISFYLSIFFFGFFTLIDSVREIKNERKLNVDILMIISALGTCLINYESEGALLLFIFSMSNVLENYAEKKSSKAINELISYIPKTALLILDDNKIKEVSTESLKIGDKILVCKGSQIPIDGIINQKSLVNEAALTGEAVPVIKNKNDEVFAGTINEGNSFNLTVNKLSKDTVFSNIIHLVKEAEKRPSKISTKIKKIENYYVLAILILVPVFISIIYFTNGFNFNDAFYRGMVFLTVASPCALIASVTPASLSAISNGARNGILFKGGKAIESLSNINTLFSDKTGTITYGEFKVIDYKLDENILKEVVYMEKFSTHPIAEAITKHFSNIDLQDINKKEKVIEISGIGLKKGNISVKKPSAMANYKDINGYLKNDEDGLTKVMVAKNNEIVGYISLSDIVRKEAKETIAYLNNKGIDVVLLTGDNKDSAKKVCDEVGIKSFKSSLLADEKINYIIESQNNSNIVAMIGDGINDAPALAGADIGIAMGSGSSISIESADVVIMQNDLTKLVYSFNLSKKLNKIVLQNILFSISVIMILILLNIMKILPLPLAVVLHETSTILVILNGLRLLKKLV